jgi:hypothetical protein
MRNRVSNVQLQNLRVGLIFAQHQNSRVDLPNTDEVVFEAVLSMDDLTRVATGETWSDQSPEREVFEFTTDVEINLEGGRKHWFSIYQDLQVGQSETSFAEYDNPFFWLASTSNTPRKGSYYWSDDIGPMMVF